MMVRDHSTLAIVDPCCKQGYDPSALEKGGLGGTEATVLRVAAQLDPHMRVQHFQRGRTSSEHTSAGSMAPLADAFLARHITEFIVINAWKVAQKLRKHHPEAHITLWLHIHPGRHNRPMAAALRNADISVVCVSASHARQVSEFLGPDHGLDISHIYNPLQPGLSPNETPRDRDALLFASSPHKGLAQVFAQFSAVRQAIPTLRLYVADPGYLAWDTGPAPDGVTFLGALPHQVLIEQMRCALCLFYPQTSFAETFGIVLAEANAVGTPALVHRDIGANSEVINDPRQLVDGHDIGQLIARLQAWRVASPLIAPRADFQIDRVMQGWRHLLHLPNPDQAVCGKVA